MRGWGMLLALSLFLLGNTSGGCGPAECKGPDGKSYAIGDRFSKGCNTCICRSTGIVCTDLQCPKPCSGSQPCAAGEFCEYPQGNCGKDGQSGLCTRLAKGCQGQYAPVCGCDGKTYGNACAAAAVGVSLLTQEKCAESKGCLYNGKQHPSGASFPASDGCNTCTCTSGKVVCTEKPCLPKDCTYQGKALKHGKSTPAGDGCNTCACDDGKVQCSRKACGCLYDGQRYEEGKSFRAKDGCNSCTCSQGVAECTQNRCPSVGCTYEGRALKEGDTFPAKDGCNTCRCKSGSVTCSKNPCGCTYEGKSYGEGTSFRAKDGCNTCTCGRGQVSCTTKTCPKACGTRNLAACPKDSYCDQPRHCGSTDLPGSCKARPRGCNGKYDPVCGCDGKTYINACAAAAAGISIKAAGKCK